MKTLSIFFLGLSVLLLTASNLNAECYEVTGSGSVNVDGIYYEWRLCEHRNMDGNEDYPDRGPSVPVMSYYKPGTDFKMGYRGCQGVIAQWIIATHSSSDCSLFTDSGPSEYYARNPGHGVDPVYPYSEFPPATPFIPKGLNYCYNIADPSTGECYNPSVVPYTPAPTANTATNTQCTSFTANWAAPDCPPDEYRLDVAADSSFNNFVPGYQNRDVGSTTSYNVTGLAPDTTYYYRVRAFWTQNTSANSNTVNLTTDPPPPPPGDLTFSNETQTTIRVNWSANGNPSGTQYYCENMDLNTNSGWITDTSWTFAGLACGTSYRFRARARNSELVESEPTAISQRSTTACPDPGELQVTPAEGLISSGIEGGSFDPASLLYTLTNVGGSALDWSASADQPWVTLSATEGSLAAGADTTVGISINSAANSLAPDTHVAIITFTDTTNQGVNTRSVSLTVIQAGFLSVEPLAGIASVGYAGGPFTPLGQTYTIHNPGGSAIDWSASGQQPWVTLSAAEGTLAAGASITVDVSINSAANSLAPGSYDNTVDFFNTTNGSGDTTRSVNLTVADPDFDGDGDGVSDKEEAEGPNGGDCNGDGDADSGQSNVACIMADDSQTYVAITSAGGATLQACASIPNPHPEDCPDWVDFDYGFFRFTIVGVSPGGNTSVTIKLPDGLSANAYYKYGPLPSDPISQWYRFKYENSTGIGAQFNGNEMTLHFKDGDLGDDDLVANGIIHDDGGPGLMNGGSNYNSPATSTGNASSGNGSGGVGGGCLIDTVR